MKKEKRFKHHKAGRGGWSEWVYPIHKSYLFKCCDCGLVHEMQFGTFVERDRKQGTFNVVPLPKEIRAMFRARRERPEKWLKDNGFPQLAKTLKAVGRLLPKNKSYKRK